jgi:hypothetical protein
MYATEDELLAVTNPCPADAVAQRAVRMRRDVLKLVKHAVTHRMDDLLDSLQPLYFTACVPLMGMHHLRNYDFMAKEIAEETKPDDITAETDWYTLLPVMINNPEVDEAAEIMDECDADYKLFSSFVPTNAVVN